MSDREMLINYVSGEECRIAIVEDGRLEELYQERASADLHVGNIYKGRVVSVEPSIQAAFIDFGLERNGFLHITDLHPMYFRGDSKEDSERVGKKTPHRDRPPIQACLRRGQEIIVQVLKEGIGSKGPTLSTYISIPGRFLVMMPFMERLGVSRKVEDEDARREMRKVLDELNPPKEFGFIIRTAGLGRTKTELKRDLAYLVRLWKAIEQRRKRIGYVGELYTEADLIIRTIRDVFSTDVKRVIVDDLAAARRAEAFLTVASPRTTSKVLVYRETIPLFDRYDIERQIENVNLRQVPLPSGGSLVIDSTEAMVAIDINSGKNRENRDAETTAYKTNIEAIDEISRQLRLRDLGGVIVLDLIDMRASRHRRDIEQRFRNNLKNDRARTRINAISQFGILEMTRQRMRPSLKGSIYIDCPNCSGIGHVKSPESVVLNAIRRLAVVLQNPNVARVDLTVSPDVAFHLLNQKRHQLVQLEQRVGKPVTVRVGGKSLDYVAVMPYDAQDETIDETVTGKRGKPVLRPIHECDEDEQAAPAVIASTVRDQATSDPAPSAESLASSADADDDEDADGDESTQPKSGRRRRRRRGGRRRGKNGAQESSSPEAGSATQVASDDAGDASPKESDAGAAHDDQAGGSGPSASTASAPVDDDGSSAVETTSGDESQGSGGRPRRRRRRRGGGGGKSVNASSDKPATDPKGSDSDQPTPTGVTDGEVVSSADTGSDNGTEKKSPRRRRRRSRSRKTAASHESSNSGDDTSGTASPVTESGSGSAATTISTVSGVVPVVSESIGAEP